MHCIGIGVVASAWRNAKESGFRIDCIQLAIGTKLHPTNIVTNGLGFPTRDSRNEHCKIGFATCRRKCCSNVFVSALWIRELKNEHVLGQPTVITCHHTCNAQCEALLAQQCIAAVTRAIAPDLASVREVRDVFVVWIAWPCRIFLACFERSTNRMQTRHPLIVAKCIKRTLTHARHNAHAHSNVCAVGELHADMCNR